MSFIETEASYRIEVINGKPVKIITPQTEITLTNTKTGQEYNSHEECQADIDNSETDTTEADIRKKRQQAIYDQKERQKAVLEIIAVIGLVIFIAALGIGLIWLIMESR